MSGRRHRRYRRFPRRRRHRRRRRLRPYPHRHHHPQHRHPHQNSHWGSSHSSFVRWVGFRFLHVGRGGMDRVS